MTEAQGPVLDVDVSVGLGEFKLDAAFTSPSRMTVLFGPSGSGKTTILNLIAGEQIPRSGYIRCCGVTLTDTGARIFVPKHRRRVGYVYQDSQLFPHLTVEQNLKFGRWFSGSRPGELPLAKVVEALGIGALLKRRPTRLSGGEKQRVALGRALLSNPRLLLMDEPLASLDGARKEEILQLIEHIRDEFSVPMIYVTHALDEARRLADTAVRMRDGRVEAVGPAANVLG